MASTPVIGTGPVAFTTAENKHVTIPLGALSFDNGAIKISGWVPPAGTPLNKVEDWLKHVLQQDLLTAATVAVGPAFDIEAKHPGASGNTISIKITKVAKKDPLGDSLLDVEANFEQVYTDLTTGNLVATLGTTEDGGTKPGLVFVVAPTAPQPTMPADFAGAVAGTAPPKVNIPDKADGTKTAFALQAPGDGGSPTEFKVVVAATAAAKFDLTVSWKKTLTDVKLSDLDAQLGYVVKITPPADGFKTLPALGEIKLLGGKDPSAIPSAKAKATVRSA
jgi:hypothetical protein